MEGEINVTAKKKKMKSWTLFRIYVGIYFRDSLVRSGYIGRGKITDNLCYITLTGHFILLNQREKLIFSRQLSAHLNITTHKWHQFQLDGQLSSTNEQHTTASRSCILLFLKVFFLIYISIILLTFYQEGGCFWIPRLTDYIGARRPR